MIKSFVFGVAVTGIALFEGYDAEPTAEGVSGATTRTVVTSIAGGSCRLDFHFDSIHVSGVTLMERTLDLWVGIIRVGRHRAPCWCWPEGRQFRYFQPKGRIVASGELREYRRPEGARAGKSAGVVVGRVTGINFGRQLWRRVSHGGR